MLLMVCLRPNMVDARHTLGDMYHCDEEADVTASAGAQRAAEQDERSERNERGGASRAAHWPTNSRWNFVTLGADIAFFSLGLGVSSSYTVLPLFASHLTTDNTIIALIPAIRALGTFAPQLLIAPLVERRRHVLPMILVLTIGERLPFLLLALAAFWLTQSSAALLLGVFFALLFITTLSSGLCYPPWLDLIARAIPDGWLGRFLGFWSGIGGVLSIGGAALAATLIATFPFPLNFALCFLLTFGAFIVSFILLALGREPARTLSAQPPTAPTEGMRESADVQLTFGAQHAEGIAPTAYDGEAQFHRELTMPAPVAVRTRLGFIAQAREHWALLWGDRGLRRVVAGNALAGIATMAAGLFAVAALRVGGLSDTQVGVESAVLLIAMTGGNFLWGVVGDRWGHRAVLAWGMICAALSAGLALVAHGFWPYALVFALLGLNVGAIQLAQLTYIAEFGPPERRPTYIALASVAYAPFAIGAPILGGWLADRWGYAPVFVVTALVATMGAVAFQFWVPDARQRRDMPGANDVHLQHTPIG